MRLYGITAVAQALDVHPSSLRRWEEQALISPRHATMGKRTLRIYDEETVRVLRRAKQLMDKGISVSDALGRAHDEITRKEEQHND